jgi:hypothetical protein
MRSREESKKNVLMTREEVVTHLTEREVDNVMNDGPEELIAPILENGCIGWANMSDADLIEYWNDAFGYCDGETLVLEDPIGPRALLENRLWSLLENDLGAQNDMVDKLLGYLTDVELSRLVKQMAGPEEEE